MPVLVDRNLAVCFHPAQLLLYLLPVQIVTGLVHGFRYFHRSNCRSFCQAVANRQLTGGKLWDMAKKTAASEPQERPYKTTGVHLPADLWELLNRVAFERARTRGGRASVSALLVQMIERNRKALELELGKTVR